MRGQLLPVCAITKSQLAALLVTHEHPLRFPFVMDAHIPADIYDHSLDRAGEWPGILAWIVPGDRLARTFEERSGIRTAVEASLADERLPPEVETVLYRLVQEALTNVVKHAAATGVSIVLTRREGGISALVEDDGRGFAEQDVSPDALGLVGMRERLGLLGGTLTIESKPGGGTSLAAYVPAPSRV